MRQNLDRLFDGCAWLAAISMVAVLLMVLLSVVGRLLHFYVPGTDAYAGYCMAGAGFLALAHTLKRNEHIRVTLLLGKLKGKQLYWLELWALSAACALAGLFAWFAIRLAWQSYTFHDVSTSNDATPLWIPQIVMVLGTLVLLIAFLDEWILHILGKRVTVHAETRHE